MLTGMTGDRVSMNIFVHSDEPQVAFDAARRSIPADLQQSLRPRYRDVSTAETYTVAGRPGATTFEVK